MTPDNSSFSELLKAFALVVEHQKEISQRIDALAARQDETTKLLQDVLDEIKKK